MVLQVIKFPSRQLSRLNLKGGTLWETWFAFESIQVHTVISSTYRTQSTHMLIKFKQRSATEIAKIFHNQMLSYSMNVSKYCMLNGQILANGYSFGNRWYKFDSEPVISNLTSWFSRSGPGPGPGLGPRHIHWKGTQWTSTIAKHTQTQTGQVPQYFGGH